MAQVMLSLKDHPYQVMVDGELMQHCTSCDAAVRAIDLLNLQRNTPASVWFAGKKVWPPEGCDAAVE